MKFKFRKSGYTLIELMLVVAIISVLASIASPRLDLLLQRAHQSKARNNLGSLRSAIALYYSDLEGKWPMANNAEGNPTESLNSILAPKYIEAIPTPKVMDRTGTFNSLALNFDTQAEYHMSQSPVEDVLIVYGAPAPNPFTSRPYGYDAPNGVIYINNDAYTVSGESFYQW